MYQMAKDLGELSDDDLDEEVAHVKREEAK